MSNNFDNFTVHAILPQEFGRFCSMVAYRDPTTGELFFFGNAAFYCMGLDQNTLKTVVPPEERIKIPIASGIYLKTETVRRLAAHNSRFLNWFDDYVKECTGDNPGYRCPRPRQNQRNGNQ